MHEGSNSSASSQHLLWSVFLIPVILVGVKLHLVSRLRFYSIMGGTMALFCNKLINQNHQTPLLKTLDLIFLFLFSLEGTPHHQLFMYMTQFYKVSEDTSLFTVLLWLA